MSLTVLDTKRVAIVGAGVMGRGIAQVAATAGYRVTLVDNDPQVVDEEAPRPWSPHC